MTPFYEGRGGALYQGESLAMLRELPDASVDAVVTDPPYSSGGVTRGDRMKKPADKYQETGTFKNYPDFVGDNRDGHGWAFWSTLWISECFRALKDGGYFMMFTDWRQLPTATDVFQAGGLVWRGVVVWDKGLSARPQPGYFRSQCEYVVWGTKGGMAGTAILPGCYTVPIAAGEKQHLTAKPVELMTSLLRPIPEGGLVLDPFMGSGTTCVAAAMTGRRYIGMECSAEYCEIVRQRVMGLLPLEGGV